MEVLTDEEKLVSVRSLAPDTREKPAVEITGPVRAASGPWTLEEGWWSGSPAARAYWDVELEGGGLYRLFRDTLSGDWFADGVYD
jgi:hypothetical protein